MKYGQTLRARSVPQWAYNNLDYNELKHLIKVHTTRGQGQAITVPGHDDVALQKFEDAFFQELYSQHERIDDFVKDKANEIGRRLQDYRDKAGNILTKLGGREASRITVKQRERLSRLEGLVLKCKDDAHNLQRYIEAQALGFRKLLKKYKKWTGSATLGTRFNEDVLSDPKSFVNRDFHSILSLADETLAVLHSVSPSHRPHASSAVATTTEAQQDDDHAPTMATPHYWNEYDDGSDVEREDEPYAIYIEQNQGDGEEYSMTTLKKLGAIMSTPVDRLKSLFRPPHSAERQPLVADIESPYPRPRYGSIQSNISSDGDDASSAEYPHGYATHYATFPSVSDQKHLQKRERLLFQTTIACFVGALVLVLVAGTLIATGKHKLRAEVDAGAMVGVVASLCFATMGLGAMLSRTQRIGWFQRVLVGLSFVGVCVLCGILLVFVAANS